MAQYLAQYANEEYMWDEAAAAMWLDPSLVTKEEALYVDVDCTHGPGYGNTLTWPAGSQPGLGEQLVHVPTELNLEKFYRMFVELMTRPTSAPPNSAAR